MKKTLTYTADRIHSLTLDQLREFIADAEAIGVSRYQMPEVTLSNTTAAANRDRIKKISVDREVR